MRRTITKLEDGTREDAQDFPDAFVLRYREDYKPLPSEEETLKQMQETIREEIIASFKEGRPPVFYLPREFVLEIHPASFSISDEHPIIQLGKSSEEE